MVKAVDLTERDALLLALSEKKVRLPEALGDGVVPPSPEDLVEDMLEAGWTEDPGTGRAVLLDDGSEMLNPTPMAPPVDYDTSPDAFTMWQQNLQRMANIRDLGNVELDSVEDAEDFDVPDPEDVLEFVSVDDIREMFHEAPALERKATRVEEVKPEAAAVQATRPIPDGDVG